LGFWALTAFPDGVVHDGLALSVVVEIRLGVR